MNKETRSFIWGLILLLICATALAIHIVKLRSDAFYDWVDWTMLTFSIIGSFMGYHKIHTTIE